MQVPTSLWSVYQKNKESKKKAAAATPILVDIVEETIAEEESNTEGLNVASIMSYATPEDTNDDDNDNDDDNSKAYIQLGSKVPKVFTYSQPSLPTFGEIKIHSFGKELTTTTAKPTTTER